MSSTTRPRSSLWSNRTLIWNFAQRDLKARFKGTALGWAWSLMVPIATLLTYTFVVAIIFRASPPNLGNGQPGSFPLWLFAGLIPWSFFLITVNTAIPTLLANGPLLQKVYVPAYAPIVASAIAILAQTSIEFGVLGVALVLIGNVGLSWLAVPVWLALFFTFATSLALSLAVVNVYFRDVAHLVNVALQLLFFLTPIIYDIGLVPETWLGLPLRAIVSANPIAQFVVSLRSLTYDLVLPPAATWLGLVVWTAIALGVARATYRRWGLDIGENV